MNQDSSLPLTAALRVEDLCTEFEEQHQAGKAPRIEDFLVQIEDSSRRHLLRELLRVEVELRRRAGQTPEADDYRPRFPDHADLVEEVLDETINKSAADQSSERSVPEKERHLTTPQSCAKAPPAPAAPPAAGDRIGRYLIERELGSGGFGQVLLARDEELERHVAIKIPRPDRDFGPQEVAIYLTEARTLASLDHPHIVPVHDVGRTESGHPYIVSKYIEGSDLAQRIKGAAVSVIQAVRWTATVAEALHYAHKRGLVHRDIKPGNILLDLEDTPYVVDFGLALKETDLGKGPRLTGTVAYMSPEQARGEAHRVDGRSDIYSLGAVLYELLTGRRTFTAVDREELLKLIARQEPKPPRQINDQIPKELERICLKALSRRASDRYTTAKDMAEDLRHFLGDIEGNAAAASVAAPTQTHPAADSSAPGSELHPVDSDSQPIRIVPKGLRSFDEHDADFFLELLPGPRDREGLPDSIRFWKTRIEEPDADQTFAVGLIYGPSGCGKSSLMKAALLPRLSPEVISVYVECTGQETELRLLRGLRKRCPGLPQNLDLTQTLVALRRGHGVPAGRKVLIVLDQFEQWLHAQGELEHGELVQALRQCDGGQVQCIVMVRDDFWMATSRFMRELEIRLMEGQNSAAVDLFDTDHARRVLAAFGRAYGRIPEDPRERTAAQQKFLDQAIRDLAQDGKVICVRLSLFAELMKGKSWAPGVLAQAGGAEGVGVAFLQETFSETTSPPEHRYHQQAACKVLNALLPETGTNIRGHMRTHADLLDASGYTRRPQDFEDLLNILDRELRLITPTDPEGMGRDEDSSASAVPGQKHYQLTHDYLVPSLRQWLTRRQRETRRGRAELRLAERAALWNAKPENRNLPAWWEDLSIRCLTERKKWTQPQQRMMRRAAGYFGLRTVLALLVLAVLGVGGEFLRRHVVAERDQVAAETLVDSLLRADVSQVRDIVDQMQAYRQWANPLLVRGWAEAADGSSEKLHLGLALLDTDPAILDYLYDALLTAQPGQFLVIREFLGHYQDQLGDRLWQVVRTEESDAGQQRLRAAGALAAYDPDGEHWPDVASEITSQLVSVNPVFLGTWQEALRPIRTRLVPPLARIVTDTQQPELARSLATTLLAEYAADDPETLVTTIVDADADAFNALFSVLERQGDAAIKRLRDVLALKPEPPWDDPPLDPAWKEPSAELRAAIETAQGMLAERFAFCTSLPWDNFSSLAEDLRASGYRPTQVRPYRFSETRSDADGVPNQSPVLVAAVWTRDAKRWELQVDLTRDQLPSPDTPADRNGLLPADVSPLPAADEASDPRFVLFWCQADAPEEQRYVLTDLTAEEVTATQRKLGDEGFRPHTITASPTDAGLPPVASEWTVTYYAWDRVGPEKPPADWAAVVASTPLLEQKVAELTFDWRKGPVAPGVPINHFALVATSDWEFPGGRYRLQTWYDDGVRIYLDDELIFDKWSYNPPARGEVEFIAKPGKRRFRVEYFQIDGAYVLSVAVGRVRGRYSMLLSNRDLGAEIPDIVGQVDDIRLSRMLVENAGDESREVRSLSTNEHFQECIRLVQEGFRPVNVLWQMSEEPVSEASDTWSIEPQWGSLWHRPVIVDAEKERLAQRQANAGAALLRMEETGPVWPLLQHQPDPRVQTWLIHRLGPLGVDARLLAKRLLEEPDASIRQALILGLGQYETAGPLPGPDRSSGPPVGLEFLREMLLGLYRDDPDPGIHGAAGWLLRRWGYADEVRQIDQELATGKIEGDRRWFVNGQGQTLVVIPGPVEFSMGSPAGERDRGAGEILHRCRIERSYAIGSTEVTVEQFLRFRVDFGHDQMQRSPEGDCPVLGVTWYEAAEYCNWLSGEEGLPEDQWCYVPNAQGRYAEGMQVASDWLSRRGYRLPTEAEWENACRAGTMTSYGFGESCALFGRYGWYLENSQDRSWPVGTLLPNALGLFDTHGNVSEWCTDWYLGFPSTWHGRLRQDDGLVAAGASGSDRVSRGGGWISTAWYCRSANRLRLQPSNRINTLGFRLAFSSVDQSGQ